MSSRLFLAFTERTELCPAVHTQVGLVAKHGLPTGNSRVWHHLHRQLRWNTEGEGKTRLLSEVKGASPCTPEERVKSATQRQARWKIGTTLGIMKKVYMSLKQSLPSGPQQELDGNGPYEWGTGEEPGDRIRGTAQDHWHMTTGVCLLMLWLEAGAFVYWVFWQPQ